MKRVRSLLSVVIALCLVIGCSCVSPNMTVSAAAKEKKITVKAAPDFTLKLPADWKDHYVVKKSKDKGHGSYVAFFSKKCYKQKKEGWLFTIMRYKDDSYEDMPLFELVGKWNGYNYVALFPTDIQTMGATKAAKKEYRKLNAGSDQAAASIRPVIKARKGKNIYRAPDFTLKLPAKWKNNYTVKINKQKQNSYVAFFEKSCYSQNQVGWLFSIGRFKDTSYQELPCYEVIGKWNGTTYVVVFPTDVQFEGVTETAKEKYLKLSRSVDNVVRSIRPR